MPVPLLSPGGKDFVTHVTSPLLPDTWGDCLCVPPYSRKCPITGSEQVVWAQPALSSAPCHQAAPATTEGQSPAPHGRMTRTVPTDR